MDREFLGGYTKTWWEKASRNRVLIRKYNTMDPLLLWEKQQVLAQLINGVEEHTLIEPPFYCDEGKNITIGKNFYANYNLTILDADKVTIGDNVVIGPNVTITAAAHPVHPDSRIRNGHAPIITAPVTIGDNVWIGANATILMGVTIGSGSTVGAGSVVTRDIPPGVVAAGVPCRVIREITDEDLYEWSGEERRAMNF